MKISAVALAATIIALLGSIAYAAHRRDGVIIHNSGSTNFSGYTIKLWSDGSASVVRSTRAQEQVGQPSSAGVPLDLTRKFFADLKAAKESGNIAAQTCMKSASFGSSTVVHYHGWTSPDLECPGDGFVVALAAEAHQVAEAVGVRAAPVRRRMLPNEPRRVPESSPSQASPSPESTP